jgi:hypothetical protein
MGEMVLAEVVMTATMLVLPPDAQEFELSVARSLYGAEAGDPLEYEDRTFRWIFETYLEGMQAHLRRAIRPSSDANMIHHERGEQ